MKDTIINFMSLCQFISIEVDIMYDAVHKSFLRLKCCVTKVGLYILII